jgi:hypothetical protein
MARSFDDNNERRQWPDEKRILALTRLLCSRADCLTGNWSKKCYYGRGGTHPHALSLTSNLNFNSMELDTESIPLVPQTIPGSLDDSPVEAAHPRSPSPNSIRAARLAALERGKAAPPAAASSTAEGSDADVPTYEAFDEHYERRQEFRRMVDPGIMRKNRQEDAVRSLRVGSIFN